MEPPPADVSSQVPGAAKDLSPKGASTGEPGSGTPDPQKAAGGVDGLLGNSEIKATEGVGGLWAILRSRMQRVRVARQMCRRLHL